MIRAARHVWSNPWVRLAIAALLATLCYLFVVRTAAVWVSLGIAYTVAYLTYPITRWFSTHGFPKWLGRIVTVFSLLILLGVVSLVLSQVVEQLVTLANELPGIIATVETLPQRLQAGVPERFRELFSGLIAAVREPLENASTNIANWLSEQSGAVIGEISTVVVQLLRSVVIPVMTVYLIFDFERVNASFRRTVPPRHRDVFDAFVERLDVAAGAYIKAQLLLATMVGTMIWLGLALLGLPMAMALGFLAGVGNLIPFFGPILAGVPAVLVALAQGPAYAGLIALFIFAVQQFDGHVLTPMIFSHTTRLHPLAVIVAIIVGFTFFGLVGAFLAVPLTALLVRYYREDYLDSAWYRGQAEDTGDADA